MQKLSFLTAAFFSLLLLVACDPEDVIGKKSSSNDLTDYEWDSTNVTDIYLKETSVVVSGDGASVSGTTVTINHSGDYRVSGTLNNGQIVVNTSGRVKLILNNASVTNTTSSPLFVKDAKKTILILPKGTNNSFTDGANYLVTADTLDAAIYSKDYLALSGAGRLTVNANYDKGIKSTDELIIQSGNITVNSVGDGIKGKDYLQVLNGNITVVSGNDALKSDNEADGLGYIDIQNGTFDITAAGDGISAQSTLTVSGGTFNIVTGGGNEATLGEASAKGMKGAKGVTINGGSFVISSADKCLGSGNEITLNSGTLSLSSADKAIHADSTLTVTGQAVVNVTAAHKGLGAHYINVSGGEITIVAKNDGVKASKGTDQTTDDGSAINVSGGTLLVTTKKGDGIDSNGSITMTGGTVVVQGSVTSSDDALVYRGVCNVNGGVLAVAGANLISPSASSAQRSVLLQVTSYIQAGGIVNIQDATGTSIVTFMAAKYAYYFLVSSPQIANGATCSVYFGGSVSGTSLNGYYPDGVYTTGTLKKSFTVSGIVTSVGI